MAPDRKTSAQRYKFKIMEKTVIDAFILYNARETAVREIVRNLETYEIKTFFWDRDITAGEIWKNIENEKIKEAKAVLVFLGEFGWGETHLRYAKEAQELEKRIIPILIGKPTEEAFKEANGLFDDFRYLDFTKPTAESFERLVKEIKTAAAAASNSSGYRFTDIISILKDGSEEKRATLFRRRISDGDRPALAARLREEIQTRFTPDSDGRYIDSPRPENEMSSIRSWMFTLLAAIDAESKESRELILRHINESFEREDNVRFWLLAGLYGNKASYLSDAADIGRSDSSLQVSVLGKAILGPDKDDLIKEFQDLLRGPFETSARPVLRMLRVVPMTGLVRDVYNILIEASPISNDAYDALYALSHPRMAQAVVPFLKTSPGLEQTIGLVVTAASEANPNTSRNFANILFAFNDPLVESTLKGWADPSTRGVVRALLRSISDIRLAINQGRQSAAAGTSVSVTRIFSDAINVNKDRLGIQEDVQTLAAIIAAKDTPLPLAIGLFGDWGTGKSFFMRSMESEVKVLEQRALDSNSRFCSNIAQIWFNAWHYADTNLWASLVSHILMQLEVYVAPEKVASDGEDEAALEAEHEKAKNVADEAETEKNRAQKQLIDRQKALQEIQIQRQKKEITFTEFRMDDFAAIIKDDGILIKNLENSLGEMGVPATLKTISDLSQAVSEANTVRSRIIAFLLAAVKGWNIALVLISLVLVLFVIPVFLPRLIAYMEWGDVVATAGTWLTQVVVFITGFTAVLRTAVGALKAGLGRVEKAKAAIDARMALKRGERSAEEENLLAEISSLKAKEQEATSNLSAAAARVVELEERIRAIKKGRSMAQFLAERNRSDDYSKHLGVISTIRKDFDSLAGRFIKKDGNSKNGEAEFKLVDRIILYIDDLDRCPADKVMEVLQAVHLLFEYPLFVVVVGVDPRWLLNSLETTYSAFCSSGSKTDPGSGMWRTTPQNYLEKIFQIQFNLNPMTRTGYQDLISELLSGNESGESRGIPSIQVPPASPGVEVPDQPGPASASGDVKKPGTPEPRIVSNIVGSETTNILDGDIASDETKTASVGKEKTFVVREESLEIQAWEITFADELFAMFSSPRAVTRFTNIYRILKARIHPDELFEFEGSEESPGTFQVPMLLLAMLIGAPDECKKLFPLLRIHARKNDGIGEIIQTVEQNDGNSPVFPKLSAKIGSLLEDPAFPYSPEAFREWIPRVARFSFDVGRAVQSADL